MSLRAREAFFRNCERVCSGSDRVYLWTFTRKWAEAYKDTSKAWNSLLEALRKEFPHWRGIRVYEVHPKDPSHGLHVHVITNRFFSVQRIRAICRRRRGWGRVHVVARENAMLTAVYLCKYLQKPRPYSLKGWRLWQAFGDFEKVRVRDILVDSFRGRVWKWLARNTRDWDELNYYQKVRSVEWHETQFQNRGIKITEDLERIDPPKRATEFGFTYESFLGVRYHQRKIDQWATAGMS